MYFYNLLFNHVVHIVRLNREIVKYLYCTNNEQFNITGNLIEITFKMQNSFNNAKYLLTICVYNSIIKCLLIIKLMILLTNIPEV